MISIQFRKPHATDGYAIAQLIKRCPPLDQNSVYCNLLQASHFADTAILAENDTGTVVGFISGYRKPANPETLFVWQVAIDESARGQGLASRMLTELVGRLQPEGVSEIETTITKDNQASWALFTRFAETQQVPLTETVLFERDSHFNGEHDSEWLVHIGPLSSPVRTHKAQ